MTPELYYLLATAILTGWFLLTAGLQGKPIDDHPLCKNCKFDLTGKSSETTTCPECGSNLLGFQTIQIGHRKRRLRFVLVGIAMIILPILLITSDLSIRFAHFDPIRIAPTWWLVREAKLQPPGFPNKYVDELLNRATQKKLDASDAARIVPVALQFQADIAKPWNFHWGDLVETLQSDGLVTAADWQTYVAHDQAVTLIVRQNVARGDPIPFALKGEPRGGSIVFKHIKFNWNLSAIVPGAVLSNIAAAGGGFGGTWVTGFVPLDWNRCKLKPGSHSIQISLSGTVAPFVNNPTIYPAMSAWGTWNLLPDGQKSVTLDHDETLAQAVWPTLKCRAELIGDTDLHVTIEDQNSPADLAYTCSIRLGKDEWNNTQSWLIVKKNEWSGGLFLWEHKSNLAGKTIDVILHPSIEAAAKTVQITKLLDHEFVFKDMPVKLLK